MIAMHANRSFVLSNEGAQGRASQQAAEWVLSQEPVHLRTALPADTWVEVVRRATDLSIDDKGRHLFPEGAASCKTTRLELACHASSAPDGLVGLINEPYPRRPAQL